MSSKIIDVPFIAKGTTQNITLPKDCALRLPEGIENASFDRVDDHLVVQLEGGGTVLVQDFFAGDGNVEALPSFVLADGVEISGENFLAALAPDLDLSTAAGPLVASMGGGLGSYDDLSGAGVTGVEKLSALSAPANFETSATLVASSVNNYGFAGLGGGVGQPVTGEGVPGPELGTEAPETFIPQPDPESYKLRSVVYGNDPAEIKAVFGLLHNGTLVTDPTTFTWSVKGSNGYFVLPPTVNADGTLSLSLSDLGKEAMAESGNRLYDYFIMEVNGQKTMVQVIVSKDGTFNQTVEDALNEPDPNFLGGWQVDKGGMTGGSITTDKGFDHIFIGADQTLANSKLSSGDGADSIHIAGSIKGSAVINAGAGNDTVHIDTIIGEGGAAQPRLFGDSDKNVGDGFVGGNDYLRIDNIKLDTTNSAFLRIAGDAYTLSGNAVGGNDTIVVGQISGKNGTGNANIYLNGDSAENMYDSSRGGNDSISIERMSAGRISGDGSTLSGNSQGGDDTINITWLERNTTSERAWVYGDATYLQDNAKGGDDLIKIKNMDYGLIAGDVGGSLYGYSVGGNDRIEVENLQGKDSSSTGIGGDAADSMYGHSRGGNDTITIGTMSGSAFVTGDAKYGLYDFAVAGDDTIKIGTLNNGIVSGDAQEIRGLGVQAGNDYIRVDTMNGGTIFGDAFQFYTGRGGDDTISIGTMTGGIIGGDVTNVYGNGTGTEGDLAASSGGNDVILVERMEGGVIAGDFSDQYYAAKGICGDDFIHVNTMAGGSIYGDSKIGSLGGDDTIIVDLLEGANAKVINGGGGQDLFVYNNDAGHTISLDSSGKVTILDADKNNITQTTNASITGFEGVGGGSGDDVIIGNAKDNIIMGGAGNDTLTGNGGADTFVWKLGDVGSAGSPFRDVITDFNVKEDKLDLRDLLGDGAKDNLDDYLQISQNGHGQTVVNISTAGGAADGAYDQVIILDKTSLSAEELMNQIIWHN